MVLLGILVVALVLGGAALVLFAPVAPDWYAPRAVLPCPVCGNPDRNCEGRVTSACTERVG